MSKATQGEQLAVIASTVKAIERDVEHINTKLDKNYVTRDKHALLEDKVSRMEKIVYGVVSLILIAVVGAMLRFIIL